MVDTTILIVDDDRTIVRLCQHLLERASYKVISVTNPLDALKILRQQKVDLLLSDIQMPVMDGFEMIRQAKECQPHLPVLVMTVFGSVDNAIQALHRGVDGLLLKPFENPADLVLAVQRVLEESQQKRDAARLQVLRPLFHLTERLLTETSPEPLEKLILEIMTELFQTSLAGIYRFTPQMDQLEVIRVSEDREGRADFDINGETSLQNQLILNAILNGVPAILNANPADSQAAAQALLMEDEYEALMIAPIQQKESQLILCASRPVGKASFTEADLEMFTILARQASVAMENARLYSELKDKVRQVEESQRALVQAEKMAAVGRLMASLAHEINNPLQSVRNCLHLASQKGMKTGQRQRYLDMTDKELERLVTTVRRMLDFYRPGEADCESAHVQRMTDRVLALIRPQLREQNIQIHMQAAGRPAPVNVVSDQIQQVIFNLLLNAMDAVEEGSAANRPKEIWLDIYYEEDRVRILVEDSGPGIPVDLSDQLFEPFMSTKPHGTGLGLAVSYGIMEKHHGGLTIKPPRYGAGACFEMVLPIGDEAHNGKNFDSR